MGGDGEMGQNEDILDNTVADNGEERPDTNEMPDEFDSNAVINMFIMPPQMAKVVILTLGFVLLVIGANLPSAIVTGMGIALLVLMGVSWMLRMNSDAERERMQRRMNADVSSYRDDLVNTLDGYGLQGKYDERDLTHATDEYVRMRYGSDTIDGGDDAKTHLGR